MENVTDKEDIISARSVRSELHSCFPNTTNDTRSLWGVEAVMIISEAASLASHVRHLQTGCGSLDPSQPRLDITLSTRPEQFQRSETHFTTKGIYKPKSARGNAESLRKGANICSTLVGLVPERDTTNRCANEGMQ